MNIQSTQLRTYTPGARPSNPETSTFSEGKGNLVTGYLNDHPYRALADVFNVSVGVPASLGYSLGAGSAVPHLLIGGAFLHGASALINAQFASDFRDEGYPQEARTARITALGDALTSVGLSMAAGGLSGPLSLGFIAAGTTIATVASR